MGRINEEKGEAMKKHIVIIGGGPAGYVAAIRASKLGAKVSLIEEGELGGTCLNRGCIPTKALCKNAEVINTIKDSEEFGITVEGYTVDIHKIQDRKNKVVEKLVGGIIQLLKNNGVEVIKGVGTFIDKNNIKVQLKDGGTMDLSCDNVIIATGSKPSIPPIKGIDEKGVMTSEEILNLNYIPKSLLIIGGGVIGMEFASIFNSLGTKVTVVEFLNDILDSLDRDIKKRLTVLLKKQGIDIHTSSKVVGITKGEKGLLINIEGKKGELFIEAEKVLLSVGRKPYFEGLNLQNIGVEYDKKGIKVDENYSTNIENIYAVGDAIGGVMLAHAASYEGEKAVYHIMGIKEEEEKITVPSCIFVSPEVATAGITEEQAKDMALDYRENKFMFGANGKALAMGETDGFIKIITEGEDNNIIGVHIMGPHASDLIEEGVLAINKKMNVSDIKNTIHPHPTLTEAFFEAVLGITGEAIHSVKR